MGRLEKARCTAARLRRWLRAGQASSSLGFPKKAFLHHAPRASSSHHRGFICRQARTSPIAPVLHAEGTMHRSHSLAAAEPRLLPIISCSVCRRRSASKAVQERTIWYQITHYHAHIALHAAFSMPVIRRTRPPQQAQTSHKQLFQRPNACARQSQRP